MNLTEEPSLMKFEVKNFTTPEDTLLTTGQVYFISTFAVLCSIITVLGNFLVILSLIVNPTLRYFSNFIILSLAVSDFIIGKNFYSYFRSLKYF